MTAGATRWIDRAAVSVVICLLVGQVLHLGMRDRIAGLSVLFYVLPLPVIAAGWLVLAGWWMKRRKRRQVVFALLITLVVGWLWLDGNRSQTFHQENDDLRVRIAFWNAARSEHPIVDLMEWLPESKVDALALVEAPRISDTAMSVYRQSLPGWQIRDGRGGRVVFCRGAISAAINDGWKKMENRSSVLALELKPKAAAAERFRLVIADVGSNPFYPRNDILDSILKAAGSAPATVVVGDFNTPVESVNFDAWRQRFYHGATEGGISYRETWPWFAPVLCIDHLWFSKDFSVQSAWRKNFFCSDHSMVIVAVGFVRDRN